MTTHPQFPLDGFDEQQKLLKALNNDTLDLLQAVSETQDEGVMRSAIRAIFATIEAKIWVMKQEYLGFFAKDCTPYEIAYLTEESQQLRENGLLKAKQLILSVKDNL
jgi:hypothetical protein